MAHPWILKVTAILPATGVLKLKWTCTIESAAGVVSIESAPGDMSIEL